MLHVSYKTIPSRPLATLSGAFCLCTIALNCLLPEYSSTLSWSQEWLPPQTHTPCVPLPWETESFITYFISLISTHLQSVFSFCFKVISCETNKTVDLFCNLYLVGPHLSLRSFTQHAPSVSVTAHQPSLFSRGSRDAPETDPSWNSSC